MDFSEIIGYSSSGFLGLLTIIFHQKVQEEIGKIFSKIDASRIVAIYILFLIFVSVTPGVIGNVASQRAKMQNNSSRLVNAPKTKEEVYVEAGKALVSVGEKVYDAKQKKDSVRRSTRDEVWVYQIGLPKNEEEIFKEYKKLIVAGVTHLQVFQESRKKYFIIKNDGSSQAIVNAGFDNFKNTISEIEHYTKAVDLMSLCPLRKKLVEGDQLVTKDNSAIPCLICD